jgi:hypothetical protein
VCCDLREEQSYREINKLVDFVKALTVGVVKAIVV